MSEQLSSPLQITDVEFELICEALTTLRKRSLANAELTRSGYRTASSDEKRNKYLEKAEMCHDIITKIAVEFS